MPNLYPEWHQSNHAFDLKLIENGDVFVIYLKVRIDNCSIDSVHLLLVVRS